MLVQIIVSTIIFCNSIESIKSLIRDIYLLFRLLESDFKVIYSVKYFRNLKLRFNFSYDTSFQTLVATCISTFDIELKQ